MPVFENADTPCRLLPLLSTSSSLSALSAEAKRLRELQFDEALLLTNSFSSALVTAWAGVPVRRGFRAHSRSWLLTHGIPFPSPQNHQAAQYNLLLNGTNEMPEPRIHLTVEERAWADDFLKTEGVTGEPLIGMAAAAAYGAAKCWPPDRYAALARRCVDELGARVIFFGAPSEAERICSLCQQTGRGAINAAGRTTLRWLFALIERCRMVVCNDSGVMHAAAALQTPLTAIIGPTNARITGPLAPNANLVDKQVECAPCMKRECPLKHHRCMTEIGIDEVFEIVKRRVS